MSPLFCTTDVPFDLIGEHMMKHTDEHRVKDGSRRLLVGGMAAKKILLASPLLKWYLDHGMEVTAVHQVIEYTPKACFRTFEQEVSNARRAGDIDPSKSIIADSAKLMGKIFNSNH